MGMAFTPAIHHYLKFGVKMIDGYPYMLEGGEACQVELGSDEDIYWDTENGQIFIRKKTNSNRE